MGGQIVRLVADQFDAAIAFLNRCFSDREPMDFARMLPTLYQREDAMMQNNYAIVEDGEIAAIVGLFPLKLQVGDVSLRLAGIGGVSAAPEKRGQGLMTRLMSYVRDEVVRHGYDLSYLGGARQRYRHFGWEVGGTEARIVLGKTARGEIERAPPELVLDEAPADAAALERMKELHDAREMRCIRDSTTFSRTLVCWHRTWWTARDGERIVGYLVVDKKNGAFVPEIVAQDDETLVRMALAWTSRIDKDVSFILQAKPQASLRALSEVAEWVEIRHSGNWQVFNWSKVLDAMLRLRHRQLPLMPGEVVIGLPDGQRLHLEVRDNGAGCINRPERAADVSAEPMQLVRACFGPAPARIALNPSPKVALLDSWCPLPLAISDQDRV